MSVRFPFARSAAGLLLTVVMLGCSASQEGSREQMQSNLRPLASIYGKFMAQHQGKPPANETEFNAYVASLGVKQLAALGIDDPEKLFVSPRDHQPYIVLYGPGVLKGPPGPAGMPVVAYEQVGVGGKRFVASSYGAVEAVDEARFRALVPGGH
jgi:hypothetical protein